MADQIVQIKAGDKEYWIKHFDLFSFSIQYMYSETKVTPIFDGPGTTDPPSFKPLQFPPDTPLTFIHHEDKELDESERLYLPDSEFPGIKGMIDFIESMPEYPKINYEKEDFIKFLNWMWYKRYMDEVNDKFLSLYNHTNLKPIVEFLKKLYKVVESQH